MKNKMDELLKNALAPMDVPDERLNYQVLGKIKEKEIMDIEKLIAEITDYCSSHTCVWFRNCICGTPLFKPGRGGDGGRG